MRTACIQEVQPLVTGFILTKDRPRFPILWPLPTTYQQLEGQVQLTQSTDTVFTWPCYLLFQQVGFACVMNLRFKLNMKHPSAFSSLCTYKLLHGKGCVLENFSSPWDETEELVLVKGSEVFWLGLGWIFICFCFPFGLKTENTPKRQNR